MTLFSPMPELEASLDRLIAEQAFDAALTQIVVGVHNHYKTPGVEHRKLFYPGLDQRLATLAEILAAQCPPPAQMGAPGCNTLIIASELPPVGGHARVVMDLMAEVASPTVVLTDVFTPFFADPRELHGPLELFRDASLIVLPQRGLWEKCRALLKLVQRLNPRDIFYFQHHQDPIPFIATLGHAGSGKTLVHHTDHNPCMGCTLPGVGHVDFTEELAATCAHALGVPTTVLPLYVPDRGLKRFAPVEGRKFSVVTSGSPIKFARAGEQALQNIVQTALSTVDGDFFHIGPLDPAWHAEIQAHLQAQDIDPARFKPIGSVPSLWQSLLGLDAHVYIGSAPIGGARAAIEAQGCGYPLAFYRTADRESLTATETFYADPAMGWTTLQDLSALLQKMAADLPRLSQSARGLYEKNYSREQFRRVLGDLGASLAPV